MSGLEHGRRAEGTASSRLRDDYASRVYAGWLGKAIGVRHGANVENWSYERIERTFGEVSGYLHTFKNFAADDDTNGPPFFLRALEDYTHTSAITPEQMGLTLLNYAPDGHSFFWWGGYGISTEHTAYMNLKNGIPAPASGSIAQNGKTVAEQIGGQIFIDAWGMIAPGNPRLAAEYAGKMASVTHDGNGKYGGMFIAACIAEAFVEQDLRRILEAGLSVIPSDCGYARMVRAVAAFHEENPGDWRACRRFVVDNFGYDKHPGVCHIIPNSAIIVLSLLYGEGDFGRAINICNRCGWDTDCNVANVGSIMGVRNGLEGIDASWREPINDFLCCSSVLGALNITDLPACASYTARFGYRIAEQPIPERLRPALLSDGRYFHFEYPGSTHAFRLDSDADWHVTGRVVNTDEAAAAGERSLKVAFDRTRGGYGYRAYVQTYYRPEDFNDSRYDPSFSPILYPGQTVCLQTMVPDLALGRVTARVYVKDVNRGQRIYGEPVELQPDRWTPLRLDIPRMASACIGEAGVEYVPAEGWDSSFIAYVDEMSFSGEPDYETDFAAERMEVWFPQHREVSQFTYLRGLWELEDGQLSGGFCGETAECYTGDPYWTDYTFKAVLVPQTGACHRLSFRVQGAIRSYAAGLAPNGKAALYKNDNGYSVLAEADFPWKPGKPASWKWKRPERGCACA